MNSATTGEGLSQRSVADLASASDEHVTIPAPRSRWAMHVLLPAAILVAVAGLLIYASWERIVPATPVRVVPVVVKSVQGQDAGTVTVQAPGWVEPDPHPYYASALADGIVDSIMVLAGESVEAGQVVARMVDDDARLALAQAEALLEQRRADLDAAQASLRAAEIEIEHLVGPRQAVATSEARVAEIGAELARIDADLLAERARCAEIKDEHDRKRALVSSKAVSEAEVRRLELRLEAQMAVIEATGARKDVLRAQRVRADADLAAARRNVELLIEERRQLGIARAAVRQSDAAVLLAESRRDEAALRLDRMQVRSPVDGVVMVRLASPGSKLMREGAVHSAHVVHIYDPSRLQVRVDVPLADAASVGVDQRAEIIVEVLPDRVFAGRVTRVVHEADIAKNTMEVKVSIEEPIPQIKPEMLARVRFLTFAEQDSEGVLRQRVFAPAEVLMTTGDGRGEVLVVGRLRRERGRVEQRSIALGSTRVDGWCEVIDGLRPGDLLVMNAPATLKHGDRVRVLGETSLQPRAGAL